MSKEIIRALQILRPNSEWNLVGDDFADIQWLSDDVKPTAKQVADKIAELPAIDEAQANANAAAKAALLNRLGITAEEAKLLLS